MIPLAAAAGVADALRDLFLVLGDEEFGLIVGMAILTTVIVPPVLRMLAPRLPDGSTVP